MTILNSKQRCTNHLFVLSCLIFGLLFSNTCLSGATTEEITTLKVKAKIAEKKLQIAIANKKDVGGIISKMQQVKVLADQGKFKLANALLDEVLLDFTLLNSSNIHNYNELIIIGENSVNGVYDPALEYAPDGTGWLAYSAVDSGQASEVQTRIARSDNQGLTWTRVAKVNNASEGTVTLANGESISGKWWHEVPTLVYDPGDKGNEWKLFWHKYFTRVPHESADDRILSHGWIAYRSAPSPEGPWSNEIALIGADVFPLAPYSTKFKINNLKAAGQVTPNFKPYIVLTEPGSLYFDGQIYLSFQAIQHPKYGENKHDIILIVSDDHGQNWKSVAVVLHAEEADTFGGDIFTGSSLVVENERVFLLITPEKLDKEFTRSRHKGTIIFEFEDLSLGELRRDRAGKLIVIKSLEARLTKGGQSDYDAQNINGGIVMPQFDMQNFPKAFRIFNTHQSIVGN